MGSVTLTFTAINADGTTKTQDVTISVSATYTFTASAASGAITTGETIDLDFNIAETLGTSACQMKFTVVQGSTGWGTVRNGNGAQLDSDTYYPVNKGSFNWEFTGGTAGFVALTFTVTNAEGTTETMDMTITII